MLNCFFFFGIGKNFRKGAKKKKVFLPLGGPGKKGDKWAPLLAGVFAGNPSKKDKKILPNDFFPPHRTKKNWPPPDPFDKNYFPAAARNKIPWLGFF